MEKQQKENNQVFKRIASLEEGNRKIHRLLAQKEVELQLLQEENKQLRRQLEMVEKKSRIGYLRAV